MEVNNIIYKYITKLVRGEKYDNKNNKITVHLADLMIKIFSFENVNFVRHPGQKGLRNESLQLG